MIYHLDEWLYNICFVKDIDICLAILNLKFQLLLNNRKYGSFFNLELWM